MVLIQAYCRKKVNRVPLNSAGIWSHVFMFFTTICASTSASNGYICHVLPRGATNSSCPVDSNPCFDINTYVQHISKYFVSNTTFNFLPGNHILDTAGLFNVQSIDSLALIGNSSSKQSSVFDDSLTYNFTQYDDDRSVTYLESLTTMACTGYSGFSFSNVTNLQITNLTITNCGVYSPQTSLNAAIHLLNISNLGMEGVTIKNSTGYGILGINIIGNSAIVMSSFIGNNQFIKYDFQHESIGIKCNNNVSATNTVYKYKNSSTCSLNGGNLYIKLEDPVNITTENNELHLENLVLSLGIDGSYPNCTNPTSGTGLTLSITQQSFNVHVTINNTVSYRNQGQFGANFYFGATSHSNITMYNITSKLGVSKYGSIYYYAIPSSSLRTSIFAINNSFLECNHAWLCGSLYIDIPERAFHHVDIYLWRSVIADDISVNYSSLFVNSCNKNTNVYIIYCNSKILQIDENYGKFKFVGANNTQLIVENSYFMYTELNCEFVDVYITNSTFNYARGTLTNSAITLNGAVLFSNVTTMRIGGALFLFSSKLIANEYSLVQFVNNKAFYGGAIFMDSLSTIYIYSQSNLSFINNVALLHGGAIFILEDALSLTPPNCFFQFGGNVSSEIDAHMYFEGNYAAEAGSVLYGGNVDNCVLDCSHMPSQYHNTCTHSSGKMFNIITVIGSHDNSTSLISSDPTIVCYCNATSDPLVCQNDHNKHLDRYPGQEINLSFITLGQRNGIVPGIVYIWYLDKSKSAILNTALKTSNHCETYSIPVRRIYDPYTTYFSSEQAFNTLTDFMYALYINITVLPCPLGFAMDNGSLTCGCNDLLKRDDVMCNIDDQLISFSSGAKWVGSVPSGGIGIVDDCPFEYCNVSKTINLHSPDLQCKHNHSGVYCGQCQGNQSMMLGSSQCTSACSNTYLLLLIPFAIMGVALVAFLLACDFTVANGTINIFILYAFVIKLNAYLFFSPSCNPVMKILSVFISWLNLDLGIETCFYENMESIGKVWLQFAFSFYVSAIIGAIVLAGRISTKISRLCRYRIVPVIATLILLFYSKMLRTILIIFTFKQMDISLHTYHLIWTYDGSKEYLANKSHIGLFIFGLLVTVLFIIPYTLLLLLTPYLIKLSHWRVFSWINRIKPLVDSYEAPFKDRYRFWTGAMLVYRIALIIASTYFSQQPTMILLMIIIVHAGIVFSGFAVYKSWVISAMETTLHVNLIINSMAIYFLNLAERDFPADFQIGDCLPSAISIGVSFLCFLVILLYNTFKPLLLWIKMKMGGLECFQDFVHMPMHIEDGDQEYREPLMSE